MAVTTTISSFSKKTGATKTKTVTVPDKLIYEYFLDTPTYYKGWRDVMFGKKKEEQIMGSSIIHSEILGFILQLLYKSLDLSKFKVYTGEIGYFVELEPSRKWINADIAIVSKEQLSKTTIAEHYLDVPAEAIIEVDTKADVLDGFGDQFEYYDKKTKMILASGVKRVLWVFSRSERILVAEAGKSEWIMVDWNNDVRVIDEVSLNLSGVLQ